MTPPAGWEPPVTQADAASVFSRFASSTDANQRVALIDNGEAVRAVVAAGVAADTGHRVVLVISGVRTIGASAVELLYAMRVTGPDQVTPYPLIGRVVRNGAHWLVSQEYACGLQAFLGLGCPAGG